MMKNIIACILTCCSFLPGKAQGYQVNLDAKGFRPGIAYLTYYMGDKYNIEDSAAMNNNGIAIFKGKEKLQPGIYIVFFPDKQSRIEFLVDKEQVINIRADSSDLVNKTVITGSKENIPYSQYQKFVAGKGKLMNAERKAYMASTTRADSLLHEKNYNQLNNELQAYREDFMKANPNAMMTVLFKAMKEPVSPSKVPVTHADSVANYNFYKDHFWDGVTFMDSRIIRSPFFLKKLERYYREVLEPDPDKIIKDMDYKLLLARSSPEMYKYLLNWFTDEYITPKYMGQDAVFVHLYNKYHSKGMSGWLNEKQMESITRRAMMLMGNLIGEKAAPLDLLDAHGKVTPLEGLAAEYTIVAFWDPNCGHCKTEIPKLDSIYNANWKKHGVKVYAVLTPDKGPDAVKADWIKFIADNKLQDWTHVYQSKEIEVAERDAQKPGFRQLYDIQTTPTLFLLDKEKRIVAKKLDIYQLNDLLEYKWNKTN